MAVAKQTKKIFDDRYEILSVVGRGTRSVVYHAKQIISPFSDVAIKVLLNKKDKDSNNERLRREALALVSCYHRYVVSLVDFHALEDLCYLCMEYASLGDLRKYVDKIENKRLDPTLAKRYLVQMLEALDSIHVAGILHRDIKPDNILVLNEEEIRLADFGVATLPGDENSLEELRRGVGTLDYMPPEVMEGIAYTAKSDLYALALTFYELLTGLHPFNTAPFVEQMELRKSGKITPIKDLLPDLDDKLAAAIMAGLEASPEKRIASAAAFLDLLDSSGSKSTKEVNGATAEATSDNEEDELLKLLEDLDWEDEFEDSLSDNEDDEEDRIEDDIRKSSSTVEEDKKSLDDELEEILNDIFSDEELKEIREQSGKISESQAKSDKEPTPTSAKDTQREPKENTTKAPEVEVTQKDTILTPTHDATTGESVAKEDYFKIPEDIQPSSAKVDSHGDTKQEVQNTAAYKSSNLGSYLKYGAIALAVVLIVRFLVGPTSPDSEVATETTYPSNYLSAEMVDIPATATLNTLPDGFYVGTVDNFLDERDMPIVLLSLSSSNRVLIYLGMDNWNPVEAKTSSEEELNESGASNFSFVANGVLYRIRGKIRDGLVQGFLEVPEVGFRSHLTLKHVMVEEK